MSGFVLIVTKDQLERAGAEYVANGPASTAFVRQQEVDGALMFLQCEALAKHRKCIDQPAPTSHPTVLSHHRE